MTRTAALAVLLLLPASARAVDVAPAFPNLPAFDSPIGIQDPFDGTDRLFVVERDGRIYVIQNDAAVAQRSLFLDIRGLVTTQTEGGLLGLAFHPNYESNGRFYVVYTNDNPRRTILSRFTVSADPNAADPASELRLLELPQYNLFHKGGCLAFRADGYLYLSLGDDGNSANSQNLAKLEGKLLRIDVDHPAGGRNYGIPPDNPFAGSPNGEREEIYAFGFRNPWRFSFDPPTGRLWLGDVGQDTWEEVDLVKKGRNYGWPRLEGNACYSPPSCDTTGLDIDLPLLVYAHDGSASITGGIVYRGPSVPGLTGKYVYADYITGQMWALDYNGIDPPVNTELAIDPGVGSVPAFGVDKDDELYFTSFDGAVYRFVESTTGVPAPALRAGTLASVYPNPFAATATVEYTTVTPGRVVLEILDVRGRRVSTLVDGNVGSGAHEAVWDGRDPGGRVQASGVYFCRLNVSGTPVATRRVVLVR
jgi:glucose/arabinose dehydrogenase